MEQRCLLGWHYLETGISIENLIIVSHVKYNFWKNELRKLISPTLETILWSLVHRKNGMTQHKLPKTQPLRYFVNTIQSARPTEYGLAIEKYITNLEQHTPTIPVKPYIPVVLFWFWHGPPCAKPTSNWKRKHLLRKKSHASASPAAVAVLFASFVFK